MPSKPRHHKPNKPETTEPAMTRPRSQNPAFVLLAFILLLTGGCASINLDSHIAESPEQALAIASEERNEMVAQRYLLRIASRYQNSGDHENARLILRSSQLASPVPGLNNQYRLQAMASAVALEDTDWALALTAHSGPDDFLEYPSETMAQAASLQAGTQALAGAHLDAALTLILLAQADSSAAPLQLHDDIWAHLQNVRPEQLQQSADQSLGYETQGWLELARSLQTPGVDIDHQGRLIRQWQNNWPGHPAAQILPQQLALLADLASSRPESLVLALPLQGDLASAGRAIRDGFLAAYYADDSSDRSTTDIRIVDTSAGSFSELYQELSASGADLIVGPLEKDSLAELSSQHTLPVPVLGLNYLPEDSNKPAGLYQFGLSAEDEARQIADRLAADGIRQVLVLIPHGEWGDRVERALRERALERGVRALAVERFFPEDNFRQVSADLLGITTSRNRAIAVERTIGLNVEFEPRRRQDAEGIVLVATPTIARQFKPLFSFYYGGDLPVYSPSIVYGGAPDPARDRDINGISFTDIPWVLAQSNPFREQTQARMSGTRGQLGRLFAMGADAWELSKRLPLLQQLESATIAGQTGELSMASDGAIHRRQLWARIRNGQPELLPEPEQSVIEFPGEALPVN
ncbi:MAG TPA: penicillin-binding protein activator [Marinobacter sp.]|nr:penicillin-binding protein activator [Marinobacter sp.]